MLYFYIFDFSFYLKINLLFDAIIEIEFLTLLSKSSFLKIMIILHIFELIHHLLRKYTSLFNLFFEIHSTLILFVQTFKDYKALRLLNKLAICYNRGKRHNHFLLQSSIKEFYKHLLCFYLFIEDSKRNIFEKCNS
jgi:hypothetical protein